MSRLTDERLAHFRHWIPLWPPQRSVTAAAELLAEVDALREELAIERVRIEELERKVNGER